MKYLLDTHAWVWWHVESFRLSPKVKGIIAKPDRYEEILLSALSVWEFCKLLQKKRLQISCDPREWLASALAMPKFRLVPLSPAIAHLSTTLPGPIHGDPVDQILAATAIEEGASIITKDENLRKYPHVHAVW